MLIADILHNGVDDVDRTGTGTRSIFGTRLEWNLSEGFPLLTLKRTHWPSIAHELLWFLQGTEHADYLKDHGVTIWDEWMKPDGTLGPVYGVQWRRWLSPGRKPVDQLAEVIQTLKTNPQSRRLLVSAWNPGELDFMALPPCHFAFQLYSRNGTLDLMWHQRSVDTFLGLPFNIASYALLTHMIAHVTGLTPGRLIFTGGDTHLYHDHLDKAKKMVLRPSLPLPDLRINRAVTDIDDFKFEDFDLIGYESHAGIKAKVSV